MVRVERAKSDEGRFGYTKVWAPAGGVSLVTGGIRIMCLRIEFLGT